MFCFAGEPLCGASSIRPQRVPVEGRENIIARALVFVLLACHVLSSCGNQAQLFLSRNLVQCYTKLETPRLERGHSFIYLPQQVIFRLFVKSTNPVLPGHVNQPWKGRVGGSVNLRPFPSSWDAVVVDSAGTKGHALVPATLFRCNTVLSGAAENSRT